MTINVEVIRVEVENKGKYQMASVIYKGPDSKVDNKKLVSFVNKDVFTVFKDAQPGDLFEVTSEKVLNEKDGKEYWQWTNATGAGKNVAGSGASLPSSSGVVSARNGSPRSTYETPEERAARQVYIVRQSSISGAINLLKDAKHTPSVDEVLDVAKSFERYVFATESLTAPEVE